MNSVIRRIVEEREGIQGVASYFVAAVSRRGVVPFGRFVFKEEDPLVLVHSSDYSRSRDSGMHFKLNYQVPIDEVFPILVDGSHERLGSERGRMLGQCIVPWSVVKETISYFPVNGDLVLEYPDSEGGLRAPFLLEMSFRGDRIAHANFSYSPKTKEFDEMAKFKDALRGIDFTVGLFDEFKRKCELVDNSGSPG